MASAKRTSKTSTAKRGRGRPLTANSVRMSERIFRLVCTNIAQTGKPKLNKVLADYADRSKVGTIQAVLNRSNFFQTKFPDRAAAIRAEVEAAVAAKAAKSAPVAAAA